MNRLTHPVLIAAAVMVLDLATKVASHAALGLCSGPPVSACDRVALVGPLGLLRTENRDGAFGLVDGGVAAILLPIALLAVALLAARSGRFASSPHWTAAALLAGAVAANVVDRLAWGGVTDFIDIRTAGADSGFVFNLADVALLLGIAGLFLYRGVHDRARLVQDPGQVLLAAE